MNILLIGGAGVLIDDLILKFRKEGHRVFLLTGEKYKQTKYERVFEKYNFTYDCEELSEIMESVNPDVTIFMGAFDTNFRWKEVERETARYTSSLISLLVAYAKIAKGRFIVLSSDEVFDGNYDLPVTEDVVVQAKNPKAVMLAQAEQVCDNFRKGWNLDVMVLRLDHMYAIPRESSDVHDFCSDMCLQALQEGVIRVNGGYRFSPLNERDAVEFIYQTAKKKTHKYSLYHLSSGESVTELEVAQMIQKYMDDSISIVNHSEKEYKCILDGRRFEEEYGISTFGSLEDTIRKITAYMKKNREAFAYNEKIRLPWWERLWHKWQWLLKALIPFGENVICFIPFFMINNRVTDSAYFSSLDPYLLYVLLFAIVYGQQQATFSAILSVAGYLFRQMYNRTGFAVIIDYNTYVWMAQLFILGLVVGYMRDQIRSIRMESAELEEHLSRQIRGIKDINGSNVRVKDVLEQQVINQKDSIGKIYNITSKLDQYMSEEVLFYAVEMLTELLNTRDVAIYNVVNGDYARMFSAASEKARSLGNSIRYREMGSMYESLKEHKVYINKTMEQAYPLMANAIYENDEMKMIVMIWGLTWDRMTLGQANFLSVVSYLIQNAVLRANRYMNALEEKRYMEDTGILEPEAFSSLVKAYVRAQNRDLAECTLLKIQTAEDDYSHAAQILGEKLRNSDYLGVLPDGGLYILLANTKKEEALIVGSRLEELGYQNEIVENIDV